MSWLEPVLSELVPRAALARTAARAGRVFSEASSKAQSEAGKRRMAAVTPEERRELTRRSLAARMRGNKAKRRKAASAAANRAQWSRATPEERRAKGAMMHAAMVKKLGPEGLRAMRSANRKKYLATLSREQLSAWGRHTRAGRDKET